MAKGKGGKKKGGKRGGKKTMKGLKLVKTVYVKI